ncbi:MAG: EF-P lysine aminoacylase EpmA [Hyphomonadaceae bacterium]|nr:EF-P lysine aminoacylase EpmA [Hyphomonadaceae bacterium]
MSPPPSPFWSRDRHRDRTTALRLRAQIIRNTRYYLEGQGFLEAEPNMIVASPGAETHIDAFEVEGRYLHTSPEFAMKKLLAAGAANIYALGKVWRKGETGPLHAPEFTMLEWYRAHERYEAAMDDCVAIISSAANVNHADPVLRWKDTACDAWLPPQKLTVADAFARYAGASGVLEGDRDLLAQTSGVAVKDDDTFGDVFSRVLVEKVEPHLGVGQLTILFDYPIAEAALAQPCRHDPRVAERFEVYACGVELANGFGELTDPVEQRGRLIAAMDEKQKRYGKTWPIDEDFLAALAHMPPATGCALGMDRLVMLAAHARHINDVLWTPA